MRRCCSCGRDLNNKQHIARRRALRKVRRCACGCRKIMVSKKYWFCCYVKLPSFIVGHNFVVWMREHKDELPERRRAVYDDPEYYARIVKKHNSKETVEKHRATGIAQWKNPEIRRRNLASIRSPEVSERRVRNTLKAVQARPNNKEKQLNKILKKNFPGEFRLNVKGAVVIGGLVPDFVNVNGRKLLVEHFGTYWHGEDIQGISALAEEAKRKKLFARWGFKTVIVWEDELSNELKVVEKVRRAFV